MGLPKYDVEKREDNGIPKVYCRDDDVYMERSSNWIITFQHGCLYELTNPYGGESIWFSVRTHQIYRATTTYKEV